ncbi:4-hydroxyphenylacetate 3-monooxygenase, oxygenase component [Halalkalibacter urbisdiaboli]|uniref:4-hydroxyphenylacetate 3-monooxygenase, oxygenase component n=1 Tax=Halalkalibacter urbisdiaboli TaxID=1960589 RepID=UPI000B45518C|nr:4-hydroxyphenylacetate 3-monooxygenase, oxygenase component [Halalkalibacter urbisdiaboli]
MSIRTGEQYKDRINQLRSEIWFDGKPIKNTISDHPAFKGVIKTQSTLYDLQHDEALLNTMTYELPSTKERIGTSFLIPKSVEDLKKRRLATQQWAKVSGGMLGRSPDYMNTVLTAFAASKELLKDKENCFPNHLESFYNYARKNDLCLTHTFINPQVNRSQLHIEDPDEIIAAQIVNKNKKGLVIKGARLLATQGGITDEILVFSSSSVNPANAFGFAIPSNTKGLKFICRESFSYKNSTFDYPLSARFEENDAIVVFDDVLVPWDRVFYYENLDVSNQMFSDSLFIPLTLHQVISRQVVKTEFILGVVQSIVDTINISEYQHVKEKVSEIIIALETLKALLIASEEGAVETNSGVIVPDHYPLYSAINTFPKLYPRFTDIIQLLGASGMITLPTEEAFHSEVSEDIKHYLQGATKPAEERVKLFRLAWDLCMSAFGTRQTLYERFFFGDPIRLSQSLYQIYNREAAVQSVHDFLNIKH